MSYQKMNKQYKKKWLKALRSREYKQGQGALCTVDEKGKESFCCLGVLLDVAGGKEFATIVKLDHNATTELISMNDGVLGYDKPKKFYEIARWIERNL